MNTLIVIPRMVDKDGDSYVMPLGIAMISAVLKKNGFNVFCLNLNQVAYRSMFGVLKLAMLENNIDIIATGGASIYAANIKAVLDATKNVGRTRSLKRGILTVVGGPVISTEPFVVGEYLGCDFGVMGEGEVTAVELWSRLAGDLDADCSDIHGLLYRKDNGDYALTEARRSYVDIENLPFPDYESFGLADYIDQRRDMYILSDFTTMDHPRGISVLGSRACPFRCTFCYHSVGERFRMRSVRSIIEEIEYYIGKFHVNCVRFLDDILFTDERRMNDLCDELARLGVKFYLWLRVIDVNENVLRRLKNSGCVGVAYGLESHSQHVLDSMKKRIKLEDIDRALEMTYDAGLAIEGVFIFGDPAETMDTAEETLKWVREHRKYFVNLGLIYCAPGSEIYEYAKKTGRIADPLSFILSKNWVINLTSMSDDEYSNFRQLITGASKDVNIYARLVQRNTLAYCRGDQGKLPSRKKTFHDGLHYGGARDICTIESCCVHCSEKNQYVDINPEALRRHGPYDVIALDCKRCGRRYLARYSAGLVFNLDAVLQSLDGGDVYIWGGGRYVR